MATHTKKISEISLEDLKKDKIKGITRPKYIVRILIPKIWIKNPVEGTGITAPYLIQEEIKNAAFYSAIISIEKVTEKNILLSFEVSDSYLDKFYKALRQVSDEAELI
jgi:hypothetical protein